MTVELVDNNTLTRVSCRAAEHPVVVDGVLVKIPEKRRLACNQQGDDMVDFFVPLHEPTAEILFCMAKMATDCCDAVMLVSPDGNIGMYVVGDE